MTVTVNNFGTELEKSELSECIQNYAEKRGAWITARAGVNIDEGTNFTTFTPLNLDGFNTLEVANIKLDAQNYDACGRALQFLKARIESDMYDLSQAELEMNASEKELISLRASHLDNDSWGNFSGSILNTVLSAEMTESWGGEKKSSIFAKKRSECEEAKQAGVTKRVQLTKRLQIFSYLGVLLAKALPDFVPAKGVFASIGKTVFGSAKIDNASIEGWMVKKFKSAHEFHVKASAITFPEVQIEDANFELSDGNTADEVKSLFETATKIGSDKVTTTEAVKNAINACVGKLSFQSNMSVGGNNGPGGSAQ